MIVREDGGWLWVITQPDHAALAERLMHAWRAEPFADRPTRAAVLYATRVHDVGWAAFDAAPEVDGTTGRPVDFMTASAAVKQQVWYRALEALPAVSTYAAALVAQHALTVLRRFRGDPVWAPFFAAMERARDHWFTTDVRPDGTSGGAIDPRADARRTFLQDYAAVGLGDLLSLTFCNDWTSLQRADGYEMRMVGGQLQVAPDPFLGECLSFSVPARRVAARRYGSDDELRRALAEAAAVVVPGTAVGVEELAVS
jgi:hypothetical protein